MKKYQLAETHVGMLYGIANLRGDADRVRGEVDRDCKEGHGSGCLVGEVAYHTPIVLYRPRAVHICGRAYPLVDYQLRRVLETAVARDFGLEQRGVLLGRPAHPRERAVVEEGGDAGEEVGGLHLVGGWGSFVIKDVLDVYRV